MGLDVVVTLFDLNSRTSGESTCQAKEQGQRLSWALIFADVRDILAGVLSSTRITRSSVGMESRLLINRIQHLDTASSPNDINFDPNTIEGFKGEGIYPLCLCPPCSSPLLPLPIIGE
jgi:hypothetical protein